jgi:septation ring formation regulator EzrA
MNPLIVTIIIALATFIISIFGASWLNQQAMNKRIDDLRLYLDARFDAVDARFDAVDARFAELNHRIDNLEKRVDRIERQLDLVFKPVLPGS